MKIVISEGLLDYQQALGQMLAEVELVKQSKSEGLGWFLQHSPVYTAGSSANLPEEVDNINGVPVFKTGRGGQYTFHGPGQLVCYVVTDLRTLYAPNPPDLKNYVFKIETIIINLLAQYNITGFLKQDKVGVWVDEASLKAPQDTSAETIYATQNHKKIAAIGIRVSGGVAFHGFCININVDLNYYKAIVPCGIANYGVCNLIPHAPQSTFHDICKKLSPNIALLNRFPLARK